MQKATKVKAVGVHSMYNIKGNGEYLLDIAVFKGSKRVVGEKARVSTLKDGTIRVRCIVCLNKTGVSPLYRVVNGSVIPCNRGDRAKKYYNLEEVDKIYDVCVDFKEGVLVRNEQCILAPFYTVGVVSLLCERVDCEPVEVCKNVAIDIYNRYMARTVYKRS